jgi:hypothetical protein
MNLTDDQIISQLQLWADDLADASRDSLVLERPWPSPRRARTHLLAAVAAAVVVALGGLAISAGRSDHRVTTDGPNESTTAAPQVVGVGSGPIPGAFGPVPESAIRPDGSTDGSKVPEFVEIIDHDGSTYYLRAVDAMPAVFGTFNTDDLNAPVPVYDRSGTVIGQYAGGELYLHGETPVTAPPTPRPG